MSLERYHDHPMHCTTTGKARAIGHYESKESHVVETDREKQGYGRERETERQTERKAAGRQTEKKEKVNAGETA